MGDMMLSLNLAKELKGAGLIWVPAQNDFFSIPDRGFDDSTFVITDMTVLVETVKGELAVTFHGTAEWALDHMLITDLLWLPTETQLRELLEQRLIGEPTPTLHLTSTADGYQCEIHFQGEHLCFEAFGASEAYAKALLYVLKGRK
jgi:hypothetical protein